MSDTEYSKLLKAYYATHNSMGGYYYLTKQLWRKVQKEEKRRQAEVSKKIGG